MLLFHSIENGICAKSSPPISDDKIGKNFTIASINDNENSKNFTVTTYSSGNYYCNFWLIPALRNDNTLTTYNVSVNGKFVGFIHPTKEGWQSINIDNTPSINLNKGKNIISVSTEGHEIPSIEQVRISKDEDNASIDATSYRNYLANAENNINTAKYETERSLTISKHTEQTYILNETIPLKYTFYKTYILKQGDVVNLSAISKRTRNIIDFFFLGMPNNTFDSSFKDSYIEPSNEERQGLTWKRYSSILKNDAGEYQHVSDFYVVIPKSGLYMLKMRTSNNVLATADVKVSVMSKASTTTFPKYYTETYNNVPISYSGESCIIPANANNYVVMTKTNNPETGDPMLFIEGNAGGRIVGFNDDASSNDIEMYGLYEKDAVINQVYNINTSNIHISNVLSSSPETNCSLMCLLKPEVQQQEVKALNNNKQQISTKTQIKEILTTKQFDRFEIYDSNGEKISSHTNDEINSSIKSLNNGLYFIRIIMQDGNSTIYKYYIK